MLISISTEHAYSEETTIFSIIDLLYEAGFRTLDFTACNYIHRGLKYGETEFFSDNWKQWIQEIKQYADSKGVVFNQSHNLMYNYFKTDDDTALLNSMIDRVLEACGLLEIPVTVVHPIAPVYAVEDLAECRRMNQAFFKEKAKVAENFGVKLAVENMIITRNTDSSKEWRYCNSPEQLIDLVDSIDMQNVGFCFDVGHSHYMYENIYESIMKYGERLISLHIHDNDSWYDQHIIPFSGSVDWNMFEKGIADCGYKGDFTLESFRSTIRLPRELQIGMLREMKLMSEWMVQRIQNYRNKA